MTYKPFSIIVIPYPFTDSAKTKRRPTLVLSSEKHQKETSHITLAMITSAKKSAWLDDYEILDLKKTGLKAKSIIRQKIFTLDARLIQKQIGALSKKDTEEFLKRLQQHMPTN